jgi:hypothetical protein
MLTLALVACDSAGPVTPVPGSPLSTTPTPFHVTGVVRDDRGNPIAGASVQGAIGPAGPTVLSDEAGKYDLGLFFRSTYIRASKSGYDPDTQAESGTTCDLTLHDIITLPVGESVRITVGPKDPLGWNWLDDPMRVRVIHVTAGVPTRTELRLVPEDDLSPTNSDVNLWLPDGSPFSPPTSRVVALLPAGGEVAAQIQIADSGRSRTFTLITSRLTP